MVPYVSVRTYNRLERLGYWDGRIEQKRVRKMAFDFMLKSQAEKERDLIEEFADFWGYKAQIDLLIVKDLDICLKDSIRCKELNKGD